MEFFQEISKYFFLVPTAGFVVMFLDQLRVKRGTMRSIEIAGIYFWAILVFELTVQTLFAAFAYRMPQLLSPQAGFIVANVLSLAVYLIAILYYFLSFRKHSPADANHHPMWLRMAFVVLTVLYLLIQLFSFFFPSY